MALAEFKQHYARADVVVTTLTRFGPKNHTLVTRKHSTLNADLSLEWHTEFRCKQTKRKR